MPKSSPKTATRSPLLHLAVWLLMAGLVAGALRAFAAVPSTIHYQGVLTSAGTPVNGSHTFTFRLYDAPTGGAPVWSETQSGVAVAGGLFNVQLGSVTPFGMAFDQPYFLSVQFNADAEMGRQPLASSPYALRAATADAIGSGSLTLSGNLDLPASTPTSGNIIKGGALFMHNTGFESVYLGTNAGKLTSTAGSNTGLGVNALGFGAGGLLNTAIGNAALYRAENGGFNTAVGVAALLQNTDGSNNTAIGANALAQASTGSNNIAIGNGAGGNITAGNNNISIGNAGDAMDTGTLRIGEASLLRAFVGGIHGVTPPASDVRPVVVNSLGQLGTGTAGGGGTVTSISTGSGLTGGPITASGTIGLAATQLLPPTACAASQIPKWSGSAWTCAADSAGTVTSIAAGDGLSGGVITSSGVLNLDYLAVASGLASTFVTINGNPFPSPARIGSTNDVPLQLIANGARVAYFETTANSPNIALGHPQNVAGGAGVVGATVSGGGNAGTANAATSFFATVGGGERNTASGDRAVVSGGLFNVATGIRATIAGGEENQASGGRASISGGYLNTAAGFNAAVGGGTQNDAGGFAATVAGGLNNNAVVGDYQSIGGGRNNTASNTDAAIGGGSGNTANGAAAFVGGGSTNVASGSSGVVAGGNSNNVSGAASAIGGGQFNSAGGFFSTVPGGQNNTANGDYAFAAGRRAKANATGSFLFADSTDADFTGTVANAFAVRATGGTYFYSNAAFTTGCSIVAGGGAWSCTSARETKRDFVALDGLDILARVAALPMTSWRYKSEESKARHIGPMAEDFRAAFGLGDSDKSINVFDASGVALAAIQGLHRLVKDKDAEIAALKRDLAAIKNKLGLE
ncbi:MAG: tail fiber domain-containing protein [Betaproteobacteria bacterium]|nr:tail fiber domain-containing protein [Betaproteobacteria bacterium]